MTTTTAHVTIDLDDVVRAGSVRDALLAWCEDSDDTAGGVIGPSFSTSGPGPGWSRKHDATDFAPRAMHGGALYYLDVDDGRLASAPDWTEDTYADEEIEWTEDSVVQIACPEIEDALEHPETVAQMVRAVIDYHGPESDRQEWAALVRAIRTAAEALEDIDLDDLAG